MAGISKLVKFASKAAKGKGIAAIRNANKVKKAASKEIEVLQKAGPKQASGVSKTGKQLNQSAKEAQQAKLTRQHQAKIDRLQGKIDEAKVARKEGLKTVGKRTAVGAGIVGYGAMNQAQKQSMQKRITELEGKTKSATKVNPPASASTTPSEEKKQESTQNNENNTQQSTTQRSGNGRSSRGSSYSSNGQPRVKVRPSAGGSYSSSGYVSRVGVKPVRKSSENVKAKEQGKTDRYQMKQEGKTERAVIRANASAKRQSEKTARQAKRQDARTARKQNRQEQKSLRQSNRQTRKANRRNR